MESVRGFYARMTRANRQGRAELVRKFGDEGLPPWMRYGLRGLRRAWS